MQLVRRISSHTRSPCVLTIGNFDGVHRGHRAMLARLIAQARARALPAVVMTFEPHPRELFSPEDAPARLTPLREKITLLADCGVDRVQVCRFDRALAARSAQDFVHELIVAQHQARTVVVGDDFRFGAQRQGDFAYLQQMGLTLGFDCEAMPTVLWEGERVSSSAVRATLAVGDLEHARCLLGRPFVIAGHVEQGQQLGQKLGFPTANIVPRRRRLPLSGVFAVTVTGLPEDGARLWPAVANLGVRPTLGTGQSAVLEVHILDFNRAIYGAHVVVNFLHRLREERKFPDLSALRAQITQDVAAARRYFANHSGSHYERG
jgi:riboflavin kinase/FMN adenylyltransferase